MHGYLTIGKAARLANVNPRTLRFYEKLGLLRPSSRTESGYRLYSSQDLERLRLIFRAKQIGLTLEEVKSILSLTEDGLCSSVEGRVGAMLTRKIAELDDHIRNLRELQTELIRVKGILGQNDRCPPRTETPCTCLP